MTKIKICGLTREEDIIAVNETMPDYIGFVFAESKRRINREKAMALKKLLNPNIKAVGVFVNAPISEIVNCCADNTIDLIQLHGDESDKYMAQLKSITDKPIIKAVRVSSMEDIVKADQSACDYLLFDTFIKDQYGGSGETFDWSLLPKIEKPFFLAGGLDRTNINEAVRQCSPYCLDVSSGVETNGRKDNKKIAEIVMIVRSITK